jgi:hypothetical protein
MVIYPDIEKILVSYVKTTLNAIAGYENVKVSTIKSTDDKLSEVVITASYNSDINQVMRNASAVIDVYSDTYEKASTLSLLVDSIIREATVDGIKKVDVVLGPTRTAEASQSELRSLSVDFIVKATNR